MAKWINQHHKEYIHFNHTSTLVMDVINSINPNLLSRKKDKLDLAKKLQLLEFLSYNNMNLVLLEKLNAI